LRFHLFLLILQNSFSYQRIPFTIHNTKILIFILFLEKFLIFCDFIITKQETKINLLLVKIIDYIN